MPRLSSLLGYQQFKFISVETRSKFMFADLSICKLGASSVLVMNFSVWLYIIFTANLKYISLMHCLIIFLDF